MGNRAFRMPNSPIAANTNGNEMSSLRRFGVFELDLHAGELRRNGIKIKLQEQPFQLLAELIDRPGQIVTREELRNRLWPADTYVDFDHSLNAAIRRLRDALGDSAENPRFVETVARRGYRFLAPVSGVPQNNSASSEAQGDSPTGVAHGPMFRHWWIPALVAAVVLVLVGSAIGFLIASRPPATVRITRVTANPEGDPVRTASISRDGRYLAFSDETGFYLRQVDTGETHLIVLPNGMIAGSISWAPDGDHMIVALRGSDRRSSLWEMSALGGNARKVVDDGFQPSLSPDGKQVAFVAGSPLHQRIWIAGVFGDPPRRLLGEDGDVFGTISWSPDGTKIAYTTSRFTYGYGTKGVIAIADVSNLSAGGAPRISVVLSLFGLAGPMVWAPDGRLIYAQEESRPREEDSNLWWIRLNRQLKPARPPVRLTNDQGWVVGVSAAGDKRRIAYVKGVPQPDVYVSKLQSSGTLEEPRRLTLDDRRDLPYDWTTDNKSVIFISNRTGAFSIYRQAIDQTIPELLLSSSQQLILPRLNPDGTQVLYLVYPNWSDPDYEVPLMITPLAGGPSREITRAKWISNQQCARAPATVCIYSVVTEASLKFFRFDPSQGAGTQILQIKDDLAEGYNWSLSPDGTTLAIAKGKWANEEPRIRLVSLDGAPERWLTIHGWQGVTALDWAADSRSLWASSPGEKGNVLLRIDLQGNARLVWRPKNVSVAWAIPSRDGSQIALHVQSGSANVWMLEP